MTFQHKIPNRVEFLQDGTVRMELTQGQFCIVDMEDYPKVRDRRWCAMKHGRTFYAVTGKRADFPAGASTKMHQWIVPDAGLLDHINGNGLDNRRSNLRPAACSSNQQNARLRADSKTGFRGVSHHAATGKYVASIQAQSARKHIGLFDVAEDAARAYDAAAITLHGQFAKTNEALGLLPPRSIQ